MINVCTAIDHFIANVIPPVETAVFVKLAQLKHAAESIPVASQGAEWDELKVELSKLIGAANEAPWKQRVYTTLDSLGDILA